MRLEGKVGRVREPLRILREGDLTTKGYNAPSYPTFSHIKSQGHISAISGGVSGCLLLSLEAKWRLPPLWQADIPLISSCHIPLIHILSLA